MTDVASNYRVGDVIRATKGDSVIQGKLDAEDSQGPRLHEAAWGVSAFIEFGWIIEILERGPESLPTEPGRYIDSEGEVWELSTGGVWMFAGVDDVNVAEYAPLTRIYTKEEVLTWVRMTAYAIDPEYMYGNSALDKLVRNLEVSG